MLLSINPPVYFSLHPSVWIQGHWPRSHVSGQTCKFFWPTPQQSAIPTNQIIAHVLSSYVTFTRSPPEYLRHYSLKTHANKCSYQWYHVRSQHFYFRFRRALFRHRGRFDHPPGNGSGRIFRRFLHAMRVWSLLSIGLDIATLRIHVAIVIWFPFKWWYQASVVIVIACFYLTTASSFIWRRWLFKIIFEWTLVTSEQRKSSPINKLN